MADFLRLIDVNAGGLQLKKGQGILLEPILSQAGTMATKMASKGTRASQGTERTKADQWNPDQIYIGIV